MHEGNFPNDWVKPGGMAVDKYRQTCNGMMYSDDGVVHRDPWFSLDGPYLLKVYEVPNSNHEAVTAVQKLGIDSCIPPPFWNWSNFQDQTHL